MQVLRKPYLTGIIVDLTRTVMVTAKTSQVSVGTNARMVTRISVPYVSLRVVRVLRKHSCNVSTVDRVPHDLVKTVRT